MTSCTICKGKITDANLVSDSNGILNDGNHVCIECFTELENRHHLKNINNFNSNEVKLIYVGKKSAKDIISERVLSELDEEQEKNSIVSEELKNIPESSSSTTEATQPDSDGVDSIMGKLAPDSNKDTRSFNCSHCGSIITTRFLKAGENAKCKSCNSFSIVPKDAKINQPINPIKKSEEHIVSDESQVNATLEGKSTASGKLIKTIFISIPVIALIAFLYFEGIVSFPVGENQKVDCKSLSASTLEQRAISEAKRIYWGESLHWFKVLRITQKGDCEYVVECSFVVKGYGKKSHSFRFTP